jgi:hypothetical protein
MRELSEPSAATRCYTDEVAEKRRIPPIAAFICSDRGELDKLLDLRTGKVERVALELRCRGQPICSL